MLVIKVHEYTKPIKTIGHISTVISDNYIFLSQMLMYGQTIYCDVKRYLSIKHTVVRNIFSLFHHVLLLKFHIKIYSYINLRILLYKIVKNSFIDLHFCPRSI